MRDREYNLDYLRIFACFMVVFLHLAAANWHVVDVRSTEWKVFNLYDSAVRSAVPLFVMLSGKLLLAKGDTFSLKKFFSRNIVKLVVLYGVWSLFYAVDTIGIGEFVTDFDVVELIKEIIDSKYHLWYLPDLISVYLLLPVFLGITKYRGGVYTPYICGLFFGIQILGTTAGIIWPGSHSISVLRGDFPFLLTGLSGYFLTGYTLDKYKDKFSKIKIWQLLICVIIIISIAVKIGESYSLKVGEARDILYGRDTLPVYLESVLIYLIFLKLSSQVSNVQVAKIIARLSKYTLFVYVFHVFVWQHLDLWFGISTLSFNPWISVPALSILVFAICMATAWIVDKIPVVRKWIM